MTGENEKTKPIPIRLTDETHRRLKVAAVLDSSTMGSFIQKLLDQYEAQQERNSIVSKSE